MSRARLARGCADDAIVLAIVAAQILHHGFEYAGVVVDGEKDWLRHKIEMLAGLTPASATAAAVRIVAFDSPVAGEGSQRAISRNRPAGLAWGRAAAAGLPEDAVRIVDIEPHRASVADEGTGGRGVRGGTR